MPAGYDDTRGAALKMWNQDVEDWNAKSRDVFKGQSFTLDGQGLTANTTVTVSTHAVMIHSDLFRRGTQP